MGRTTTAVIDLGSNSTRLLVAQIEGDSIRELTRQSRVTRLGRGVDREGELSQEGTAATTEVVAEYVEALMGFGPDRVTAIATSAVRDASNGPEFLAGIGKHFGIETRLLDGETEARLSYAGARVGRTGSEATLVVDIGGGSTELITGLGGKVIFHDSLQLGVVRHSERHIHSDPPLPEEVDALAADADGLIAESLAAGPDMDPPSLGIAVAGTATSLAAIDLALEPYDASRVEGHRLGTERIETALGDLAALPEKERRKIPGLHPDRAPTIVAGVVILTRVMHAFGLEQVEVSEHDILWGAALA